MRCSRVNCFSYLYIIPAAFSFLLDFVGRLQSLNKSIFLAYFAKKGSTMSILKSKLGSWFNRKIVDPFCQILGRDAEPKQLAFSTALGLTLGIFPICGVTVFLCGLTLVLFGNHCHAPSVMLSNFVATPIELSLMIPFLRLGEFVTGSPHFALTTDALKKVLTGRASREVLLSIMHALLGWTIVAPLVLGALYSVFVPTFKYLIHKFSSTPSSPEAHLLINPNKVSRSRSA